MASYIGRRKFIATLSLYFRRCLENAVRIFGAKFGNLLLYEEGAFRVAAMHDAPSVLEELRRRERCFVLVQAIRCTAWQQRSRCNTSPTSKEGTCLFPNASRRR